MSKLETANPMLTVEHLKMYFPTKRKLFQREQRFVKAVDDVSFSIVPQQVFGLVGESGCGKTTTGKCVLGIHRATSGNISFDGQDITGSHGKIGKDNQLRRDMQMVFQDPYGSLDPRQSVATILKEAILCDYKIHVRAEVDEQIDELLHLVELPSLMKDRYPHEMSGGQRQRLGIARALACNPKLIVCDEPVSALDVSIQAQVINLFEDLKDRLGLTYLFIAHDLAVVRHISDTIAVMYLGRIVEITEADELYENPLHPYTRALLSAVPTTDYYLEKERHRILLGGEVPSPMNVPSGCPFHPRCPYAQDVCRSVPPVLQSVTGNHKVACHCLDRING